MEDLDINNLEDLTLTCVDCGEPFTFSAGERRFFASKKLSQKKRCRKCLDRRKALIQPGDEGVRK